VCGVGRKSCTFLERPTDEGRTLRPAGAHRPPECPRNPVRSGAGWDAPFPERESGCAESPGSDADRAGSPAVRPTRWSSIWAELLIAARQRIRHACAASSAPAQEPLAQEAPRTCGRHPLRKASRTAFCRQNLVPLASPDDWRVLPLRDARVQQPQRRRHDHRGGGARGGPPRRGAAAARNRLDGAGHGHHLPRTRKARRMASVRRPRPIG
jgi:hypothetical protein